MSRYGVSIVGAGPGDPELITVKALKRIAAADVLLYDRLVNSALLEEARPDALLIYCGKAPGRHACSQEDIHRIMIEHAKNGRYVVRLKGGDPYVFGRGGEEALALAEAGIPYEVVPGVTSAMGAGASSGIPLTHRGLAASCAIVTGTRSGEEARPVRWDLLAQGADTLVIYMGIHRLEEIRSELLRSGRPSASPAAIIEAGTTERERVVTGTLGGLLKLADTAQIANPAIVIIGEVVRVRESLLRLQAEFAAQTG